MKIQWIAGHSQYFLLHLCTQRLHNIWISDDIDAHVVGEKVIIFLRLEHTSRNLFMETLDGRILGTKSKKQNVVERSSAEAEFWSVTHDFCEVSWIKRILEELKILILTPIEVYCDSKATISIAHNPVLHDKTKHVEVDKHFIKEKN